LNSVFYYPGLVAWRALAHAWLRRFRRRLTNGPEGNTATLRAILSAAENTAVGREFRFADILAAPDPAAAYRDSVPLRDYAAHSAAIEDIISGQRDVLFAGAPKMILATSGTSSDPKLLPTNRAQQNVALEHITLLAPAMRWHAAPALGLRQRSVNLMLASSPANKLPGGMPLGMSSAGGMRRVLQTAPAIWTSPPPVFELTDHPTALYLHALFGLLDESAGCIEAIFGSHIISWMSMIMSRRAELVDDIAGGRINADIALALAPPLRRQLESLLKPNPARAAAVDAALRGPEAGLLPRLWPNLRVLSTVVSGSFAVSLPRLRMFAGEGIPIFATVFGSTESMIGVNLWPEQQERYALSVGAAYFEFLPLDQTDAIEGEAVGPGEVRIGELYEVIVTTWAGLYRYRTGDVVRISSFTGTTPVLELDHRLGDVLDLAGEKTSERHTREAILLLAEEAFGTPDAITNYTVAGNTTDTPYRYRVYLELAEPDQAVRSSDSLAQIFDRHLQASNILYRTLARANGRLASPQVYIVCPGAFAELEEQHYRKSDGVSRNQVKVPRLLRDPEQIALLERRVTCVADAQAN
jgi:hypothetical protein